MNHEDLLRIVQDELVKNNMDKKKTRQSLFEKAQADMDLMIAFAEYGHLILQALIESETETIH